ncbi:MAG: FAD-dependent oxidoreductase [Actinobacteria bacterium]|nr:FAD-dependent oxidoreductase [Actinomycetota bacterium]
MADVVVIGAGLAGLSAATALRQSGAEVVVLEARDRVGGRVFSHRFSNGQTAERGAEFIDGNHTAVRGVAEELGLQLTERDGGIDSKATLVDAGGRAVPMNLQPLLTDHIARWDNAVAALSPTMEFEGGTLADVMSVLSLSAISRLVIGRDIRTEFMLPPDEVSQCFAAQVASRQQQPLRERHRVVGGNDQLAVGLAARLGDSVRLRSAVQSIDAANGSVAMVDGVVHTADALVAAVPLPVLSRLWSDCPAELRAIGYGVGGKISVQFERRIWRDYARNGTVMSDRVWGQLWETTDDQPGDTGVLTNLLASHDGAAFVSLPEAPDQLVREIDRVFPGAKGLAGERVVTDWTNDRHSLGTYACFGRGQWTAAQDALHARHGAMWLAGEHVDGFVGYMEGALRSGRRVAQAITTGL